MLMLVDVEIAVAMVKIVVVDDVFSVNGVIAM